MKKYMVIYLAPQATIAEMMKMSPEQQKAGMAGWNDWYKANAGHMADMGAPLGKTKRVSASGVADAHNDLTGYSVVNANSADDVAKMMKNHPHLQMKGATIDIVECMDMAGMM